MGLRSVHDYTHKPLQFSDYWREQLYQDPEEGISTFNKEKQEIWRRSKDDLPYLLDGMDRFTQSQAHQVPIYEQDTYTSGWAMGILPIAVATSKQFADGYTRGILAPNQPSSFQDTQRILRNRAVYEGTDAEMPNKTKEFLSQFIGMGDNNWLRGAGSENWDPRRYIDPATGLSKRFSFEQSEDLFDEKQPDFTIERTFKIIEDVNFSEWAYIKSVMGGEAGVREVVKNANNTDHFMYLLNRELENRAVGKSMAYHQQTMGNIEFFSKGMAWPFIRDGLLNDPDMPASVALSAALTAVGVPVGWIGALGWYGTKTIKWIRWAPKMMTHFTRLGRIVHYLPENIATTLIAKKFPSIALRTGFKGYMGRMPGHAVEGLIEGALAEILNQTVKIDRGIIEQRSASQVWREAKWESVFSVIANPILGKLMRWSVQMPIAGAASAIGGQFDGFPLPAHVKAAIKMAFDEVHMDRRNPLTEAINNYERMEKIAELLVGSIDFGEDVTIGVGDLNSEIVGALLDPTGFLGGEPSFAQVIKLETVLESFAAEIKDGKLQKMSPAEFQRRLLERTLRLYPEHSQEAAKKHEDVILSNAAIKFEVAKLAAAEGQTSLEFVQDREGREISDEETWLLWGGTEELKIKMIQEYGLEWWDNTSLEQKLEHIQKNTVRGWKEIHRRAAEIIEVNTVVERQLDGWNDRANSEFDDGPATPTELDPEETIDGSDTPPSVSHDKDVPPGGAGRNTRRRIPDEPERVQDIRIEIRKLESDISDIESNIDKSRVAASAEGLNREQYEGTTDFKNRTAHIEGIRRGIDKRKAELKEEGHSIELTSENAVTGIAEQQAGNLQASRILHQRITDAINKPEVSTEQKNEWKEWREEVEETIRKVEKSQETFGALILENPEIKRLQDRLEIKERELAERMKDPELLVLEKEGVAIVNFMEIMDPLKVLMGKSVELEGELVAQTGAILNTSLMSNEQISVLEELMAIWEPKGRSQKNLKNKIETALRKEAKEEQGFIEKKDLLNLHKIAIARLRVLKGDDRIIGTKKLGGLFGKNKAAKDIKKLVDTIDDISQKIERETWNMHRERAERFGLVDMKIRAHSTLQSKKDKEKKRMKIKKLNFEQTVERESLTSMDAGRLRGNFVVEGRILEELRAGSIDTVFTIEEAREKVDKAIEKRLAFLERWGLGWMLGLEPTHVKSHPERALQTADPSVVTPTRRTSVEAMRRTSENRGDIPVEERELPRDVVETNVHQSIDFFNQDSILPHWGEVGTDMQRKQGSVDRFEALNRRKKENLTKGEREELSSFAEEMRDFTWTETAVLMDHSQKETWITNNLDTSNSNRPIRGTEVTKFRLWRDGYISNSDLAETRKAVEEQLRSTDPEVIKLGRDVGFDVDQQQDLNATHNEAVNRELDELDATAVNAPGQENATPLINIDEMRESVRMEMEELAKWISGKILPSGRDLRDLVLNIINAERNLANWKLHSETNKGDPNFFNLLEAITAIKKKLAQEGITWKNAEFLHRGVGETISIPRSAAGPHGLNPETQEEKLGLIEEYNSLALIADKDRTEEQDDRLSHIWTWMMNLNGVDAVEFLTGHFNSGRIRNWDNSQGHPDKARVSGPDIFIARLLVEGKVQNYVADRLSTDYGKLHSRDTEAMWESMMEANEDQEELDAANDGRPYTYEDAEARIRKNEEMNIPIREANERLEELIKIFGIETEHTAEEVRARLLGTAMVKEAPGIEGIPIGDTAYPQGGDIPHVVTDIDIGEDQALMRASDEEKAIHKRGGVHITEANMDQYVEKPAQATVRQLEAEGHSTIMSNAYGRGRKGVHYTVEIVPIVYDEKTTFPVEGTGVYVSRFRPLPPETLAKLRKELGVETYREGMKRYETEDRVIHDSTVVGMDEGWEVVDTVGVPAIPINVSPNTERWIGKIQEPMILRSGRIVAPARVEIHFLAKDFGGPERIARIKSEEDVAKKNAKWEAEKDPNKKALYLKHLNEAKKKLSDAANAETEALADLEEYRRREGKKWNEDNLKDKTNSELAEIALDPTWDTLKTEGLTESALRKTNKTELKRIIIDNQPMARPEWMLNNWPDAAFGVTEEIAAMKEVAGILTAEALTKDAIEENGLVPIKTVDQALAVANLLDWNIVTMFPETIWWEVNGVLKPYNPDGDPSLTGSSAIPSYAQLYVDINGDNGFGGLIAKIMQRIGRSDGDFRNEVELHINDIIEKMLSPENVDGHEGIALSMAQIRKLKAALVPVLQQEFSEHGFLLEYDDRVHIPNYHNTTDGPHKTLAEFKKDPKYKQDLETYMAHVYAGMRDRLDTVILSLRDVDTRRIKFYEEFGIPESVLDADEIVQYLFEGMSSRKFGVTKAEIEAMGNGEIDHKPADLLGKEIIDGIMTSMDIKNLKIARRVSPSDTQEVSPPEAAPTGKPIQGQSKQVLVQMEGDLNYVSPWGIHVFARMYEQYLYLNRVKFALDLPEILPDSVMKEIKAMLAKKDYQGIQRVIAEDLQVPWRVIPLLRLERLTDAFATWDERKAVLHEIFFDLNNLFYIHLMDSEDTAGVSYFWNEDVARELKIPTVHPDIMRGVPAIVRPAYFSEIITWARQARVGPGLVRALIDESAKFQEAWIEKHGDEYDGTRGGGEKHEYWKDPQYDRDIGDPTAHIDRGFDVKFLVKTLSLMASDNPKVTTILEEIHEKRRMTYNVEDEYIGSGRNIYRNGLVIMANKSDKETIRAWKMIKPFLEFWQQIDDLGIETDDQWRAALAAKETDTRPTQEVDADGWTATGRETQIKILKALEDNKARVESPRAQGDKDAPYYQDTEAKKQLSRVTDVSRPPLTEEAKKKDLVRAGQVIGTGIDEAIRDGLETSMRVRKFYTADDGTILFTEEAYKNLQTSLNKLKRRFKDNHETIVARDFIVYDEDYAGELDILTYDREGVVRIYDIKGVRGHLDNEGKVTGTFTKTFEGAQSKKELYTKQLSMYAGMLRKTHGIEVDSIEVLAFNTDYAEGEFTTKDATLVENDPETKLDLMTVVPLFNRPNFVGLEGAVGPTLPDVSSNFRKKMVVMRELLKLPVMTMEYKAAMPAWIKAWKDRRNGDGWKRIRKIEDGEKILGEILGGPDGLSGELKEGIPIELWAFGQTMHRMNQKKQMTYLQDAVGITEETEAAVKLLTMHDPHTAGMRDSFEQQVGLFVPGTEMSADNETNERESLTEQIKANITLIARRHQMTPEAFMKKHMNKRLVKAYALLEEERKKGNTEISDELREEVMSVLRGGDLDWKDDQLFYSINMWNSAGHKLIVKTMKAQAKALGKDFDEEWLLGLQDYVLYQGSWPGTESPRHYPLSHYYKFTHQGSEANRVAGHPAAWRSFLAANPNLFEADPSEVFELMWGRKHGDPDRVTPERAVNDKDIDVGWLERPYFVNEETGKREYIPKDKVVKSSVGGQVEGLSNPHKIDLDEWEHMSEKQRDEWEAKQDAYVESLMFKQLLMDAALYGRMEMASYTFESDEATLLSSFGNRWAKDSTEAAREHHTNVQLMYRILRSGFSKEAGTEISEAQVNRMRQMAGLSLPFKGQDIDVYGKREHGMEDIRRTGTKERPSMESTTNATAGLSFSPMTRSVPMHNRGNFHLMLKLLKNQLEEHLDPYNQILQSVKVDPEERNLVIPLEHRGQVKPWDKSDLPIPPPITPANVDSVGGVQMDTPEVLKVVMKHRLLTFLKENDMEHLYETPDNIPYLWLMYTWSQRLEENIFKILAPIRYVRGKDENQASFFAHSNFVQTFQDMFQLSRDTLNKQMSSIRLLDPGSQIGILHGEFKGKTVLEIVTDVFNMLSNPYGVMSGPVTISAALKRGITVKQTTIKEGLNKTERLMDEDIKIMPLRIAQPNDMSFYIGKVLPNDAIIAAANKLKELHPQELDGFDYQGSRAQQELNVIPPHLYSEWTDLILAELESDRYTYDPTVDAVELELEVIDDGKTGDVTKYRVKTISNESRQFSHSLRGEFSILVAQSREVLGPNLKVSIDPSAAVKLMLAQPNQEFLNKLQFVMDTGMNIGARLTTDAEGEIHLEIIRADSERLKEYWGFKARLERQTAMKESQAIQMMMAEVDESAVPDVLKDRTRQHGQEPFEVINWASYYAGYGPKGAKLLPFHIQNAVLPVHRAIKRLRKLGLREFIDDPTTGEKTIVHQLEDILKPDGEMLVGDMNNESTATAIMTGMLFTYPDLQYHEMKIFFEQKYYENEGIRKRHFRMLQRAYNTAYDLMIKANRAVNVPNQEFFNPYIAKAYRFLEDIYDGKNEKANSQGDLEMDFIEEIFIAEMEIEEGNMQRTRGPVEYNALLDESYEAYFRRLEGLPRADEKATWETWDQYLESFDTQIEKDAAIARTARLALFAASEEMATNYEPNMQEGLDITSQDIRNHDRFIDKFGRDTHMVKLAGIIDTAQRDGRITESVARQWRAVLGNLYRWDTEIFHDLELMIDPVTGIPTATKTEDGRFLIRIGAELKDLHSLGITGIFAHELAHIGEMRFVRDNGPVYRRWLAMFERDKKKGVDSLLHKVILAMHDGSENIAFQKEYESILKDTSGHEFIAAITGYKTIHDSLRIDDLTDEQTQILNKATGIAHKALSFVNRVLRRLSTVWTTFERENPAEFEELQSLIHHTLGFEMIGKEGGRIKPLSTVTTNKPRSMHAQVPVANESDTVPEMELKALLSEWDSIQHEKSEWENEDLRRGVDKGPSREELNRRTDLIMRGELLYEEIKKKGGMEAAVLSESVMDYEVGMLRLQNRYTLEDIMDPDLEGTHSIDGDAILAAGIPAELRVYAEYLLRGVTNHYVGNDGKFIKDALVMIDRLPGFFDEQKSKLKKFFNHVSTGSAGSGYTWNSPFELIVLLSTMIDNSMSTLGGHWGNTEGIPSVASAIANGQTYTSAVMNITTELEERLFGSWKSYSKLHELSMDDENEVNAVNMINREIIKKVDDPNYEFDSRGFIMAEGEGKTGETNLELVTQLVVLYRKLRTESFRLAKSVGLVRWDPMHENPFRIAVGRMRPLRKTQTDDFDKFKGAFKKRIIERSQGLDRTHVSWMALYEIGMLPSLDNKEEALRDLQNMEQHFPTLRQELLKNAGARALADGRNRGTSWREIARAMPDDSLTEGIALLDEGVILGREGDTVYTEYIREATQDVAEMLARGPEHKGRGRAHWGLSTEGGRMKGRYDASVAATKAINSERIAHLVQGRETGTIRSRLIVGESEGITDVKIAADSVAGLHVRNVVYGAGRGIYFPTHWEVPTLGDLLSNNEISRYLVYSPARLGEGILKKYGTEAAERAMFMKKFGTRTTMSGILSTFQKVIGDGNYVIRDSTGAPLNYEAAETLRKSLDTLHTKYNYFVGRLSKEDTVQDAMFENIARYTPDITRIVFGTNLTLATLVVENSMNIVDNLLGRGSIKDFMTSVIWPYIRMDPDVRRYVSRDHGDWIRMFTEGVVPDYALAKEDIRKFPGRAMKWLGERNMYLAGRIHKNIASIRSVIFRNNLRANIESGALKRFHVLFHENNPTSRVEIKALMRKAEWKNDADTGMMSYMIEEGFFSNEALVTNKGQTEGITKLDLLIQMVLKEDRIFGLGDMLFKAATTQGVDDTGKGQANKIFEMKSDIISALRRAETKFIGEVLVTPNPFDINTENKSWNVIWENFRRYPVIFASQQVGRKKKRFSMKRYMLHMLSYVVFDMLYMHLLYLAAGMPFEDILDRWEKQPVKTSASMIARLPHFGRYINLIGGWMLNVMGSGAASNTFVGWGALTNVASNMWDAGVSGVQQDKEFDWNAFANLGRMIPLVGEAWIRIPAFAALGEPVQRSNTLAARGNRSTQKWANYGSFYEVSNVANESGQIREFLKEMNLGKPVVPPIEWQRAYQQALLANSAPPMRPQAEETLLSSVQPKVQQPKKGELVNIDKIDQIAKQAGTSTELANILLRD